MWIGKSEWEFERDYRKTQDELIASQENLIENLNKQIENLQALVQCHESYAPKIEKYYEEVAVICEGAVSDNTKLREYIRDLKTKNEELQASLDEAERALNEERKTNESTVALD